LYLGLKISMFEPSVKNAAHFFEKFHHGPHLLGVELATEARTQKMFQLVARRGSARGAWKCGQVLAAAKLLQDRDLQFGMTWQLSTAVKMKSGFFPLNLLIQGSCGCPRWQSRCWTPSC
jgi:hypothetical protein